MMIPAASSPPISTNTIYKTDHTTVDAQSSTAGAPSPVLDVPAEILCRIFRLCIPDDKFKRPSATNAPLVFCYVCKYWKEAAYNEPTLWTRPRIVLSCPQGARKTLQVFVDRSQNATFDLSIIEDISARPTRYRSVESMKQDLGMVKCTVPRCRELSLLVETREWINLLSGIGDTHFTNLHVISLRVLFAATPTRPFDFSSAARLRHGRFTVVAPVGLSRIVLPFAQMESLECGLGSSSDWNVPYPYHGVSIWRSFVSKCINLRDISVYFHGRGFTESISFSYTSPFSHFSERAAFTSAKSLSIRTGFAVALATIVRGFTFPYLDELYLSSTGRLMTLVEPLQPLQESLDTSLTLFSGLTTLRMLRVSVCASELLELFRSTSLLTLLDVMLGQYVTHTFSPNDTDVVECLQIMNEQTVTPILPRLRELRLYYCETEDLTITENITRYANLAMSRYKWASNNTANRDEGVPLTKLPETLPTCPFRLYLKFESGDFDSTAGFIERAIPARDFPIFFPERCREFGKEL